MTPPKPATPMSLDEFIERLSKTRCMRWIAQGGWLRSVSADRTDCHCPISAVTGDYEDFRHPKKAAVNKLGLSDADAQALFDAADSMENHDPALRARLLSAVGLSP